MFYAIKGVTKDYIWGGSRLGAYGYPGERVAEAWVLSFHPDGMASTGGRPVADVLTRDTWGAACAPFAEFPVLIKLIDAKDNLSVQVHPSDEYALKNEGQFGKTEMWYVVDCEPGASLYFGVNRALTKEEFKKRIEDNTLTDVLYKADVKKGDVFFIQSGTIHAIGAGILICEIQQNSNTTYRVFDYGRLGADGKPRALHVEKALDVARLCPPERSAGPIGKPEQNGDCTSTLLAKCGYFTARLLDVAGSAPLCADGESFHSLLCLSGSGAVICGGGAVPFAKGDSLFLPAGLGAYTIAGRAQLVLTTL